MYFYRNLLSMALKYIYDMNIHCVIFREILHILKKCKYKTLTNYFSGHNFFRVKRDLRFWVYDMQLQFFLLYLIVLSFCCSDFNLWWVLPYQPVDIMMNQKERQIIFKMKFGIHVYKVVFILGTVLDILNLVRRFHPIGAPFWW